MKEQPLKTEEQQTEFIQRFAEIVKNNHRLKGNYKISFKYNGTMNDIIISYKTEKIIDIKAAMSQQEYAEYITLLYWWHR